MCGIVGYFGSAGNNLARVLTGMAAITYRAPDSTGIGLAGDDREPIRILKSLGDTGALIDKLHRQGFYPETEHRILTVCHGEVSDAEARILQDRLLSFESLPAAPHPSEYIRYDELIDPRADPAVRLGPGRCGRPEPMAPLHIRSRNELVRAVNRLSTDYDVSTVGIHAILHAAISETVAGGSEPLPEGIDTSDVLAELNVILDAAFEGIRTPKPRRPPRAADGLRAPYARKYFWRLLAQTPVCIPPEYDRDAVRGLFRLLDASLLSRLANRSDLAVRLQQHLATDWPAGGDIEWRVLYGAEKALNVYGRAAAAAMAVLQETLVSRLRSVDAAAELPEIRSGTTDPTVLRYFAPPVIAHGRWALQSSVTEENAHPFLDQHRRRALVLNGKFDSDVEAEVRRYLREVCGSRFRSENSTEFLGLLWGFYADQLQAEQRRYAEVVRQSEAGLTDLGVGSLSIDYHIHRRVRDLTREQLDETAFVEAVRCMCRRGGQLAVCAMSLDSPGRIYVAAHNRPVFIVRRLDNDDVMVVSDVNAAMGLFPQQLIQQTVRSLRDSRRRYREKIQALQAEHAPEEVLARLEKQQRQRERGMLEAFTVEVVPLEGEEKFAVAEVSCEGASLSRKLRLTDFEGRPMDETVSFQNIIEPPALRKDLHRSYYEMHLAEIPELLRGLHRQYAPEGRLDKEMGLRVSTLTRRFGKKLQTLRRIYLIGMGSSYNMGLAAEGFIRRMVPEKFVKTIMPVEIDDVHRAFDPDVDLLVMTSWSSTTADMVEFAKMAADRRLTMIGVTEKVFGDMALVAARSGGVLAVHSGEEVTVSALKSSLCSLYCLFLLGVWLARQCGRHPSAAQQLQKLIEIPEAVDAVLQDESMRLFAGRIASEFGRSHAAMVVDGSQGLCVAREAAFKIEENSWTSIGKVSDYQNMEAAAFCKREGERLLLINVTRRERLKEAVTLMRQLHEAAVPFAAVGFPSREMKAMQRFSADRCVFLPKVDDMLQPFVDLPFYYLLAYFYGIARGRSAGEFPRNRVKSLTAGRSRSQKPPSPAVRQTRLADDNRFLAAVTSPSDPVDTSPWRNMASDPHLFERIRLLARTLAGADALNLLIDTRQTLRPSSLDAFRKAVEEEGRLLLAYDDRNAEVAAQAVAHVWGAYTGCPLEVASEAALENGLGGLPLIFVNSRAARRRGGKRPRHPWTLRVGGSGHLTKGHGATWAGLYSGLVLLLARLWQAVDPGTAEIIATHMQKTAVVLDGLLKDETLLADISGVVDENHRYRTATLITASRAVGMQWEDSFDRTGGLLANWRLMSEIAHGSLVTVDSDVHRKFVLLEEPSEVERTEGAFYAEGRWYRTQLRPDYDPTEDNLILLDATSADHRERILDELSVLGCRYPRLIVITQHSLWTEAHEKIFAAFPISRRIFLPEPLGEEPLRPISGFHLPLTLQPVFAALAGEFRRRIDPAT
jgi:glucosamine 6-phosphate synthetase-like amidotransferase/phosphosugar isomerase protein